MKKILQYLLQKSLYSISLHIILIILAVEVIVLMKQNRELKDRSITPTANVLKEGDFLYLDDLEVLDQAFIPDTTREKQLVLMLTTTCPFCKKSIPQWTKLISLIEKNFSVYIVTFDGSEETLTYLKDNKMLTPGFLPVDVQQFRDKYNLRGVPKTIIRSANGLIEKVWNGQFMPKHLAEAEEAISHINTLTYNHN